MSYNDDMDHPVAVAFRLGRMAKADGLKLADNPYVGNAQLRRAWERGFEGSEIEGEGEDNGTK